VDFSLFSFHFQHLISWEACPGPRGFFNGSLNPNIQPNYTRIQSWKE
jgi:hypothetical protein